MWSRDSARHPASHGMEGKDLTDRGNIVCGAYLARLAG
jgi:hypothetical protein